MSPKAASGARPGGKAGRFKILLQPRAFILTGLPYKRDPDRRQVARTARTGARSTLKVTYLATHDRFPLPFGADRSLLAWITTKAFPGGTVAFPAIVDYMEAFGLDRGGRGYRLFRERFLRVANLAVRLEDCQEGRRSVERLFLVPRSEEPLEFLSDPKADLRRNLLASHGYRFTVDPYFWSHLRETRVPTPLRLLRAFHSCPRGWDFAQILFYRSFVARRPTRLRWAELLEQMGSQDRDHRRLLYRLKHDLAKIKALYPACPVELEPVTGDLLIEPWRPREEGTQRSSTIHGPLTSCDGNRLSPCTCVPSLIKTLREA